VVRRSQSIIEHAGEHEHHEEKAGAGDGHEDAGHRHAKGEHMQHMVDVRKWLKEELKVQYDQPGPASAALEQKPADFTGRAHSKYNSDQGRIYIIKKGVKGMPMEGWESALNEKEVQSVCLCCLTKKFRK